MSTLTEDELVEQASLTDPEEGDDVAPEGSEGTTVDPLVLARKRQAGAEAARRAEAKRASALAAEVERLRALVPAGPEDANSTELGRLQERVAAAEARANQAEATAQAKLLDAMYPSARAKLPEVTDEVRLAEFEAMLRDDDAPPTPNRHNESRTPSGRGAQVREKSYEDVRAEFLSTDVPW